MIAKSVFVLALCAAVFSAQNFSVACAESVSPAKDSAEETDSEVLKLVKIRFECNNMRTARNFGVHQPRYFYDPATFERLDILRTNSYAILANPEKFDGKVVVFTGYLERYSHNCCPYPGDECYHIFITRDDFRNHTESFVGENFVHLRVNKHFFEGTLFRDGSLVEGVGLLKAGKIVLDGGGFYPDSASTLTNGSLRLLREFSPDVDLKDAHLSNQSRGSAIQRAEVREKFMRFTQNESPPKSVWEIRAGKIIEDADNVEATGGVLVSIDAQDSELKAEKVIYDKKMKVLRTIGNVQIVRRNMLTTGQRFDFKISSDEYLVTEPEVVLGEPLLRVRSLKLGDF